MNLQFEFALGLNFFFLSPGHDIIRYHIHTIYTYNTRRFHSRSQLRSHVANTRARHSDTVWTLREVMVCVQTGPAVCVYLSHVSTCNVQSIRDCFRHDEMMARKKSRSPLPSTSERNMIVMSHYCRSKSIRIRPKRRGFSRNQIFTRKKSALSMIKIRKRLYDFDNRQIFFFFF